MKIQPVLLQVIALALVVASCEPGEKQYAGQKRDAPARTAPGDTIAIDSLYRDTIQGKPATPDYCPPCGRG